MKRKREEKAGATKSSKARQAPNLAFKLHETTHAEPTGLGKAIAAQPRALGQGKRLIWQGAQQAVQQQQFRDALTQLRLEQAVSTPTTELHQSHRIQRLRKWFRLRCAEGENPPPLLAFERWLWNSIAEGAVHPDPRQSLITALGSKGADRALVADLIRGSVSAAEAQKIGQELMAEAAIIQSQVSKDSKGGKVGKVAVVKHRHTIDVQLRGDAQMMKLNHEHYNKLQALWCIGEQLDPAIALRAGSAEECRYHDSLYCLLCRYFTLQGPGFQAACPERVFQVLHQHLGVTLECFASPLNCYFGSFCSAFADTDIAFGSLGTFWGLEIPLAGVSLEANPPFVPSIMLQMADKIEMLLKDSSPVSFSVIVPGWLEDPAYQQLASSEFLQQHWLIPKADHGFCDGAQHQRRDRFRESPYDTSVFLLQNEAGRGKWPVQDDTEQQLRAAFATGVPTEAAMARRMKEGRGFADQDGGGGVYKGKKKNKKNKSETSKHKKKHK